MTKQASREVIYIMYVYVQIFNRHRNKESENLALTAAVKCECVKLDGMSTEGGEIQFISVFTLPV